MLSKNMQNSTYEVAFYYSKDKTFALWIYYYTYSNEVVLAEMI